VRGFASTGGSRGWYEVDNFNFSWSLYDPSGRAIKTTYAGDDWSDAVFTGKVAQAAERLTILALTPRVLAPGRYRSYLAPAALAELLGVAAWTGFSAKAQASSRSELYKLHMGEVALDPRVTLTEDLSLGITPGFNDDGYLRESVPLIQAGRSVERLTNARSAREYGLTPNGALPNESPSALAMEAGDLRDESLLAALDTGLYIGNLWYVNFSDRMNCRLTGMTRFATFWVEGGRIVAPIEAMRFDDSVYRVLGSELERLGAQTELLLSDSTWGERATGGMQLPGILTKSFELTL
jgi:predicted Zn-dependent protease